MKRKRILSAIMSILMIFSMCVPAMAATNEVKIMNMNDYCILIGDGYTKRKTTTSKSYVDFLREYMVSNRYNPTIDKTTQLPFKTMHFNTHSFFECDIASSIQKNGFANNEFTKYLDERSWIKKENVKYVMVLGGPYGDVFSGATITNETVKAGMINFQNKLHKIYPKAKILYAPLNWTAFDSLFNEMSESEKTRYANSSLEEKLKKYPHHAKLELINKYHPIYTKTAKSLGWTILDTVDDVLAKKQNQINHINRSDGYTVDTYGHSLIANELYYKIRELINNEVNAIWSSEIKKTVPILKLKMSSVGTNNIKLAFSTTKSTSGTLPVAKYVLYGNKLGLNLKKIATFTGTQTSTNRTGLAKGTAYHFQMKAYDKNGKIIAESRKIAVTTQGGKYTNAKSVQMKSTLVIKKGTNGDKNNPIVIDAKELFSSTSKTHLTKHTNLPAAYRKIHIYSDTPGIAAINNDGLIVTCNDYQGKANIYAVGLSGVYSILTIEIK